MKLRGRMYCRRCKKPVMAVKGTHHVRNTVATVGAVSTLGLSLWGRKSEPWVCPQCGGAVTDMRRPGWA